MPNRPAENAREEESYAQKLDAEAAIWGKAAEQQALDVLPDWRDHRGLLYNAVVYAPHVDKLLKSIRPGSDALELGCSSGWLTLAMAQRGARARGLDIAGKSLEIARAYAGSVKETLAGSVAYQTADLNTLDLPADSYDVIVAKGVLHHLQNLENLMDGVHNALKPGGLFWISDITGDETWPVVWIAGALTLLLPTRVSYREKFRGLIRVGLHAPRRLRASMQAEGLSPFEGAGRKSGWLELVRQRFGIENCARLPAFTGYVAEELKLADALAFPLLRIICAADSALVRLKILRGTGIVLYARKAADPRTSP
jgi:2-polyprenyl-3-methyl-5-hydroxy-6-metoxy-1,4-benzoquinol methylase